MEEKHRGIKISSHKSDTLGICQLPTKLMFLQSNSLSISSMLKVHCNSHASTFTDVPRASRKKMSKKFIECCSENSVQELTLRMSFAVLFGSTLGFMLPFLLERTIDSSWCRTPSSWARKRCRYPEEGSRCGLLELRGRDTCVCLLRQGSSKLSQLLVSATNSPFSARGFTSLGSHTAQLLAEPKPQVVRVKAVIHYSCLIHLAYLPTLPMFSSSKTLLYGNELDTFICPSLPVLILAQFGPAT